MTVVSRALSTVCSLYMRHTSPPGAMQSMSTTCPRAVRNHTLFGRIRRSAAPVACQVARILARSWRCIANTYVTHYRTL